MRKVKCDRKAASCFLAPAGKVQFGRGGLIPIKTDYLIPLRAVSFKKQSGKGHKRKSKKKKKN